MQSVESEFVFEFDAARFGFAPGGFSADRHVAETDAAVLLLLAVVESQHVGGAVPAKMPAVEQSDACVVKRGQIERGRLFALVAIRRIEQLRQQGARQARQVGLVAETHQQQRLVLRHFSSPCARDI